MRLVESRDVIELYSKTKEELGEIWDPLDYVIRHGENVKVVLNESYPIEVPLYLDKDHPNVLVFERRPILGNVMHNRQKCVKCIYSIVAKDHKTGEVFNKSSQSYCNYGKVTGEPALKKIGKYVVNTRGIDPENCKLFKARKEKG